MPPVPGAGVPLSKPAEVKVTPPGRAPTSLNVGAGEPVAVTVKVPATPIANVVWFALVITGPCTMVSVKLWIALGAMPLLAMMLIG